jgi:hypothetical protein
MGSESYKDYFEKNKVGVFVAGIVIGISIVFACIQFYYQISGAESISKAELQNLNKKAEAYKAYNDLAPKYENILNENLKNRSMIQSLNKEIDNLKTGSDNKIKSLNKVISDLKDEKECIECYEKKIKQFSEENDSLKSEVTSLNNLYKKAQVDFQSINDKYSMCQSQLTDLKGEINYPELLSITLTIHYSVNRKNDAFLIYESIRGKFKEVKLKKTENYYDTHIEYGPDISTNSAVNVAKLLAAVNFNEFKQPIISVTFMPGEGINVYLSEKK